MKDADGDVPDALWRMEALCSAVPFDEWLRAAAQDGGNSQG